MPFDLSDSERRAQKYIGASAPLLRLGWGMSGAVFLSPGTRAAVKVFHRREQYDAELKAYRILWREKLYDLHGLTIPRPRGKHDALMVISMDVVKPPFLLDFAGAQFKPPDFSADAMALWHADIREKFGANAHIAYSVYDALRRIGIYYMDFRHSNLNLQGLPGVIAEGSSETDSGDFSS